jgi:hypothetical protein
MKSDHVPALLLTGSIIIAEPRARGASEPPAIRFELRGSRAPLDLEASEFRYRILDSGEIVPIRNLVRLCTSEHPGRRRP